MVPPQDSAPPPPGQAPTGAPQGSGRPSGARASGLAPSRLPLAGRLLEELRRNELLEPGQRVLVALSGGLDSTVLLHLLRFGLPELRLEPRAGHFDHAMRPGSDADARWVAGLCRAWRVPLLTARAPEPPPTEADARALRYRFLRSAAREAEAGLIATAHHADDQAETVLFRAVRGTGVRGLRGIPARRGRLVRPLLPFRREELLGYARTVGLSWREDPTNLTLPLARNRMRREVLPLLEEIAPGAGSALARLARLARRDEAAWASILRALSEELVLSQDALAIDLDRGGLRSYHPGVRTRLLRRVLRALGVHPTAAATRALLDVVESGRSGSWVDVGGGVRVGREFERIRIRRAEPPDGGADAAVIAHGVEGEAELRIGARQWRACWRPFPSRGTGAARAEDSPRGEGPSTTGAEDAPRRETPSITGAQDAPHRRAPSRPETDRFHEQAGFDPAALQFPLRLRGWSPGDRIRLPGGTKKLKKVFGERRVPASERDSLPVLSDGAGRILWVPGVARSTHAPPRPGEPVLEIRVLDGDRG